MNSKDKPLYIWWVSTILTLSAFFWASYAGYVTTVWQKDHTLITSLLTVIFIYASANLFYVAMVARNFRSVTVSVYERMIGKYVNRVWFIASSMMGIAIVGTVAGLIIALNVGGEVPVGSTFQEIMSAMWSQFGPAFYPNFLGVTYAIILNFQTYFMTEDFEQ